MPPGLAARLAPQYCSGSVCVAILPRDSAEPVSARTVRVLAFCVTRRTARVSRAEAGAQVSARSAAQVVCGKIWPNAAARLASRGARGSAWLWHVCTTGAVRGVTAPPTAPVLTASSCQVSWQEGAARQLGVVSGDARTCRVSRRSPSDQLLTKKAGQALLGVPEHAPRLLGCRDCVLKLGGIRRRESLRLEELAAVKSDTADPGWLPPGRQRRLVRSRRENLGGTPKGRASAAREGRRNVQRLDVLRGAKAELVIFTATSSATRFGKQEHSYRAQTQVLSHAMKMHGCVFAFTRTNRKPDSASTSQK